MTIGAWVGLGILCVAGFAIAVLLFWGWMESRKEDWVFLVSGVAVLLLTILISGFFIWWRSNSESGKRAVKDQQSNLQGGIERTVSVYDVDGDLIKEYRGKFDIETDRGNYILFDDEDGNRHIVYYTTGTVIVDEV